MFRNNKILALIPARKHSKGIPRKNIASLAGQPLIAWTIAAALASKFVDRVVVTTDCEEIAEISRQHGASIPFMRPPELALDETPGIDPVLHACQQLDGFDIVVLLQPTSPLRTAKDIDNCIELMDQKNADFCVSVSKPKHHPNWLYQLEANGFLGRFDKNPLISVRQDLPDYFALNGAIYVAKISELLNQKTLIGSRTFPYPMPADRSVDIDTPLDLQFCELLLGRER